MTISATDYKEQAQAWVRYAKSKGLLLAQPTTTSRSQLESGVSVEYLKQLSDSIREFPRLSTKTVQVMYDCIWTATVEHGCRLLDLVPPEHVGPPSIVVSHTWQGNFHELVSTLQANFARKWELHTAYRARTRHAGYGDDSGDDDSAGGSGSGVSAKLDSERRRMEGFLVWLDLVCLNQQEMHARQADVETVTRIIQAVGKTALFLDDEYRALSRLWCLYEVLATARLKRLLITLSSNREEGEEQHAGAEPRSPSRGGRNNSGGGALPSPAGGATHALLNGHRVDCSTAKCSLACDRQMLTVALAGKQNNLGAASKAIAEAVGAALSREGSSVSHDSKLLEVLTACGKHYWEGMTDVHLSELESVRKALKQFLQRCYGAEYRAARLLGAADPELDLWEHLDFLHKALMRERAERLWCDEVARYGLLAKKSYASRFSSGYVDSLLRQAGTFDDMEVLAQYVHRSCRTKTINKTSSSKQDP